MMRYTEITIHMLRQSICILALFAMSVIPVFGQYGTYTVPPGSPMANGEHPRLFFTASSFAEIATYINNHENTDFQTWINGRDVDYNEGPGSKERRMLLWEACNFAFMHYAVKSGLLSSFSFGHTADEYAAKAYDHAVEIDRRVRNENMREFRGGITGSQGGYITMTTALIYDWCNDFLSLAQKQFIADLAIFLNGSESNNRCFPGQGMNLGNDFNSQCWEVGFWGGAAMYGDDLGSNYTNDINRLKDVIGWFVFDQVFDVQEILFEGLAGNGEGGNYFGVTVTQQYFQGTGLGPALNIDFAQQYGALNDAAWFYWNVGQPREWNDGTTQGWVKHRFDDAWLSGWSGRGFRTNLTPGIFMIKKNDPDRAAALRWLVEDGRGGIGSTSDPINDVIEPEIFWLWYKFIWGYKDVGKISPSQYGLSEANRFAMGETIMHSDLTTQEATKILFYTHEWYINLHHHDDYGGFEVFKNGLLIVNNGGNWKSTRVLDIDPPETSDPSAPVFHSIMAVYTGSNSTYFHQADITPNNDTPDNPANQPGGQNNIGELVGAVNIPGVVDYYDYDYTRTYKGESYMNSIHRKMMYVRDPNAPNYNTGEEYLLIYDDVDLTTNHARRWLAKTVYEPVTLGGGSWSSQGSNLKTSSNTTELSITNTYGNNNGKMYMKVLSPDNVTLNLWGSPSSPFLNATGGSMYNGGNINEAARNFVGTYRLEIEDNSSGNSSEYLVAMQIGTPGTLPSMAPMTRIDAGDFMGAFINNNRVAFFDRDTTPSAALTYSISATGTVRHYISGLQQGAYFVRKDGNTISGVSNIVTENGVLYFEESGGGTFTISKSNDTTAPSTPNNVRITK